MKELYLYIVLRREISTGRSLLAIIGLKKERYFRIG